MPTPHTPRSGTMQFWPRKRAKRMYPRIRTWQASEFPLSGFPGYKAGMTHVVYTDTEKNSLTKGEEVSSPVTVVECPPIKIVSVRIYKKNISGKLQPAKEFFVGKTKELSRKMIVPKNQKQFGEIKPEDFEILSVLVHTQPKLVGLKKRPEIFEIKLSGKKEDQIKFVKDNIDKDITIEQVFKPGQYVDSHAVTKGKGLQGPVKRFGIDLKRHKTEKSRRNPGAIGVWYTRWHMFRVPHAGQTGFHQRTEYNKQIFRISSNPEEINPEGGFLKYGKIKNTFLLVKGSLGGSRKRLVILTKAMRQTKTSEEAPQIDYISTRSKQGR